MDHHQLLDDIDALENSAEDAFSAILEAYNEVTQANLRRLSELPEILTILTDNIRVTLLVGDLYAKEPEWVLHKADSLNLVVARQQAEELDDWKESLQNDPQAQDELLASAESFAKEFDYDDEYYDWDDEGWQSDEVTGEVIVRHHYYHHYPYWFGYPHWYGYPCWRPNPYWYDWGFYIGPARSIVVVGLPSFHFTNWYF